MKIKNLFYIFFFLFVALACKAQTPFPTGIRLNNATEVTTADSIPVIAANGVIKTWISLSNLSNDDAFNQDNKNKFVKFTSNCINKGCARDLLNNSDPAIVVDETETLFITITRTTTARGRTNVFVLNGLGKGSYGTGETQVTNSDIEQISSSTTTINIIEDLPNTQFIELGDVGSTDITTAFNAHTFTGSEDPIQDQNDGFVIVNVIINGQELQYLFVGDGGSYGTGGTETAIDEDLVLLTDIDGLPDTQFIELGEIGTAEIEDAFNAHTFTGSEDPVQDQLDGYVVVKTLVNGNEVDYLFVGEGGAYGTAGTETAIKDDFIVYLPYEEATPNNAWNIATGSVGNDTGIEATAQSQPIVHNQTVFANRLMVNGGGSSFAGIQNRDTNWLYVSGNQGLVLRAFNPNEGHVRITSNGLMNDHDTDPITWNARVGRNYNDGIVDSDINLNFVGIGIDDVVDLAGKNAGSWYASLHIDPTYEATYGDRPYYAIKSERGLMQFGGYGSGTITGTPTYNLSVDASGNVIETATGGGGGGASELSDLTDVNTSTPTDKNVLIADGVDWESRPLVIDDISDYTPLNMYSEGGTAGVDGIATIGDLDFSSFPSVTGNGIIYDEDLDFGGGGAPAIVGFADNIVLGSMTVGLSINKSINNIGINALNTSMGDIMGAGNNTVLSVNDTNQTIHLGSNGLVLDASQVVGAGQDNYVLTYDNATSKISLEAASGTTITNTSELINDGADATSTFVEHDELATVATSGDYTDLINTPQNLSDFTDDIGATEAIVANTLFVDTVLGNDGTAVPENRNRPYLTVAAAYTALPSVGWTIEFIDGNVTRDMSTPFPAKSFKISSVSEGTFDFSGAIGTDLRTAGYKEIYLPNARLLMSGTDKDFGSTNSTLKMDVGTLEVTSGGTTSSQGIFLAGPGISEGNSLKFKTIINGNSDCLFGLASDLIVTENFEGNIANAQLFGNGGNLRDVYFNKITLGVATYRLTQKTPTGTITIKELSGTGNFSIGPYLGSYTLDLDGINIDSGITFTLADRLNGKLTVKGNVKNYTGYIKVTSAFNAAGGSNLIKFDGFIGKIDEILWGSTNNFEFSNSQLTFADRLMSTSGASGTSEAIVKSVTFTGINILTSETENQPQLIERALPNQTVTINGYVTGNFLSFGKNIKAVYESVSTREKENEIIVRSKYDLIDRTLDSSTTYIVDGSLTLLTGEYIEIPTGGLTLSGYGFNVSKIIKNVSGESIFTSQSGNSGDFITNFIEYSSGDGSVFDIIDTDGTDAIELNDVNFVGCSSLGELNGYRQLTATTIGIYGCSDGFTLSGAWNGFKITNTNIFGFGSSGTLIKEGTSLSFNNRMFLNLNLDLPTGAIITDLDATNFNSDKLLQINNTNVKLNGVLDDSNTPTLVPNITQSDARSYWSNNVGLYNTTTTNPPTLTYPFTIINPEDTDDATLFYTPVAITVTSVASHISGTTNVVFNIGFSSTADGAITDVFTSDITLTSTSGQINNSGFNDATIPANSWVRLDIDSISGTPTQFASTIIYTED